MWSCISNILTVASFIMGIISLFVSIKSLKLTKDIDSRQRKQQNTYESIRLRISSIDDKIMLIQNNINNLIENVENKLISAVNNECDTIQIIDEKLAIKRELINYVEVLTGYVIQLKEYSNLNNCNESVSIAIDYFIDKIELVHRKIKLTKIGKLQLIWDLPYDKIGDLINKGQLNEAIIREGIKKFKQIIIDAQRLCVDIYSFTIQDIVLLIDETNSNYVYIKENYENTIGTINNKSLNT